MTIQHPPYNLSQVPSKRFILTGNLLFVAHCWPAEINWTAIKFFPFLTSAPRHIKSTCWISCGGNRGRPQPQTRAVFCITFVPMSTTTLIPLQQIWVWGHFSWGAAEGNSLLCCRQQTLLLEYLPAVICVFNTCGNRKWDPGFVKQ